jgi:hypothetical protein
MLRWLAVVFIPVSAFAHPGHGATELHAHLTEWSWVVLALAVAGAIVWLTRK